MNEDGPLEDLKQRINQLLWVVLPPSATVGEAEEIACRWHEEIQQSWRLQATKSSTQASPEFSGSLGSGRFA